MYFLCLHFLYGKNGCLSVCVLIVCVCVCVCVCVALRLVGPACLPGEQAAPPGPLQPGHLPPPAGPLRLEGPAAVSDS